MKNIIIFFILIIGVLSTPTLHAQIKSRQDKQLLLKADKAFDFGDYLGAMKMYETLYVLDSNDTETNYKLGICNYEIKKYRKNSKKYFMKVSATDFPEVNYYLGMLSHLANDYERAIFHFNQYKYFGDDNEFTKKQIDDLINKCNTAMLLESTADKSIIIKNLGNTINSEYSDYAPLIPADEKFMIFTSRRKNDLHPQKDPLGDYFEDIYISRKDNNGAWSVPVLIDSTLNTSLHDACTGLSADGEKLLLYRTSEDLNSGDIYESYFTENKWSKATLLTAINSAQDLETSACFSSSGDVIFFSSTRPGGYGGKDLYMVRKLQNGQWGKPFNLGPKINTEYDEDAPFLHPIGNTLFFSSQGHKNMGGFDVFKSTFDEAGKFEQPENIGSPINTSDDDIFFVMNTDATGGYLSSEREGGTGLQDIYSVSFPNVTSKPLNVYNIHVVDEANSVITDVEIKAVELEKESVYGVFKANDKTGKIIIISNANKEYRMIIDAPGYERLVVVSNLNTNFNLLYKLTKAK